MAWPNIKTASNITEKPIKGQIRSDFEAGYVYSRAKWTRGRMEFELEWSLLPDSDYRTLRDFLFNNIGSTFTWNNPIDSQDYTVRFKEDSFDASYVKGAGGWMITGLILEEQ